MSRLVGEDGVAPYWAYGWAGGSALARYVLDNPDVVKGQCVLDLGCGSGVAGIAAAMSGAARVMAHDIDPYALAAVAVNAQANDVSVEVCDDVPSSDDIDMLLAGDVYYDAAVAALMTPYLQGCVAAGVTVLVGDPGRRWLPVELLQSLADYTVADFGQAAEDVRPSAVYRFR